MILPIQRPFSNFSMERMARCYGLDSVRRILSQVRQYNAQTMVIETIRPDLAADLREENEDLIKCCGMLGESVAYRLAFFTKRLMKWRDIEDVTNADFLGYAILKVDTIPNGGEVGRIYESVIRPSRHLNNYIRGQQRWKCVCLGRGFEVEGYLYAQQNGITNVCAHVAVRTAAGRYRRDRDMSYREMNDILGIDHVSIKLGRHGRGGLSQIEMQTLLRTAGAKCELVDYTDVSRARDPGTPSFQRYLYGSIESGFPCIVVFQSGPDSRHAIPIFGHTFNEDTWVPTADSIYFDPAQKRRFISSESFLSAYIGHDDNCGSNYCIPRSFLYTRRYCREMAASEEMPQTKREGFCETQDERVGIVLTTLPSAVEIEPLEAESLALNYFAKLLDRRVNENLSAFRGEWQIRLEDYAIRSLGGNHDAGGVFEIPSSSRLILRTILVDTETYAGHLEKLSDWHGRPINRVITNHIRRFTNKQVWMVELSIPHLFSANRRKLAEVIIRAEPRDEEDKGQPDIILARLPSYFAFPREGETDIEFEYVPSGTDGHTEHYGCEDDRWRESAQSG